MKNFYITPRTLNLLIVASMAYMLSCDLEKIESQVITPPTAAFTVDNSNCTAACTVKVSNSSQNASSYLWNFGDPGSAAANTSTLQNPPDHIYTTPGTYTITLIATGNAGKKDTARTNITVSKITTFNTSIGTNGVFESGNDIISTGDGGYAIIGSQGNANFPSMYLIRIDALGNKTSEKTFGGGTRGLGLRNATENGFAVIGTGTNNNVYYARLLGNGNTVIERYFNIGISSGNAITATNNNGYLLVGGASPVAGVSYPDDVYAIRVDANGGKIWEKTFGFTNSSEVGYEAIATSDGNFVIVGTTFTEGDPGNIYLVKVDGNGNKVWEKTYGEIGGTLYDAGSAVVATSDGGFVIAGETTSKGAGFSDVYLVKVDKDGNKVWDKPFGDADEDQANDVVALSDGSVVAVGFTQFAGGGRYSMLLVKVDRNGNQVWKRSYPASTGGDSEGKSVILSGDGGFIVTGNQSNMANSDTDVLLIKTDAEGQIK